MKIPNFEQQDLDQTISLDVTIQSCYYSNLWLINKHDETNHESS